VTDRRAFFVKGEAEFRASYLSEPQNPYRMSGRSSGKERWEETRRCLCEAIDQDGDFLDVGCANGLLLETLREWSPYELTPHGIDFVAELIPYARARHPGFEPNFHVANVWDWEPSRRYTHVRTNLEYIPEPDWPEYLRRVASWGDRLIVCHYRNANEPVVEVAEVARRCGFDVAGTTQAPGVRAAWVDP